MDVVGKIWSGIKWSDKFGNQSRKAMHYIRPI